MPQQRFDEGWRSTRVKIDDIRQLSRRTRVTAALISIFGDTYDIMVHTACCYTAAAALTLRERLIPSTRTNSNVKQQKITLYIFFFNFSTFSHQISPRLNKSLFDMRNPEIFPPSAPSVLDRNIFPISALGPRSIQTAAAVVAVKSVLTLQPTGHPFSYPAGFRGPCTLPEQAQLNLAALVVCVGRTRPSRRSKVSNSRRK